MATFIMTKVRREPSKAGVRLRIAAHGLGRSSRLRPLLRSLLACSALALPVIGVTACGSSKKSGAAPQRSSAASATDSVAATTASSPGSAAGSPVLDDDADNDSPGNSRYDSDNDAVSSYGHPASVADRQVIAALIRHYYAAAAAGDGARACSLSYWLFAESVVEEHHPGKGPPSLRGDTCAQVASKLFKQRHRELIEDITAFQVAWVRVNRNQGLALLRFGGARERDVLVHRDRGAWKMNVLLDEGAP
jgi:hypothetical protein